jgi:hypothetical protein
VGVKNRIIFLNDIVVNYNLAWKRGPGGANKKFPVNIKDKIKHAPWSRYLGPYLVAQSIEDNLPEWEVIIIDYFTKIDNFHQYINDFINNDTKYIAISSTFLHNSFSNSQNLFNFWCSNHREICDWFENIKQIAPHIKFIIGGCLIDNIYNLHVVNKSKNPLPTVLSKYFSYVFKGYGEDTIINFLKGELDKQYTFTTEGVTFINEPKRAGKGAKVIKMIWQDKHVVKEGEWLPLEISKGCRFGCKFCFYDAHGTVIKEKNILKDELLRNYEYFGVKGYSLTDDTINDSPQKNNMMYDVISNLPFKIEWIGYTRPDMFYKYPEMYFKMKEMGCRGMFYGVETLTHKAGKIAGKGLHPDKIKEILNWTKKESGDEMFHLTSFIIGLVGETEETLMETAEWLRNQRCIDKIQYEILFVDNKTNAFGKTSSKFGFKEITWDPEYYWKHETLDSTQCKEIANTWEAIMENHPTTVLEKHTSFNTSFWAYPRMRSLGLNHKEAFNAIQASTLSDNIHSQNIEWTKDFHSKLTEFKAKWA